MSHFKGAVLPRPTFSTRNTSPVETVNSQSDQVEKYIVQRYILSI